MNFHHVPYQLKIERQTHQNHFHYEILHGARGNISDSRRRAFSLRLLGDDARYTSMAKTVGLPVAIAAKLILSGAIKSTGVKIPTTKDIYVPVLKELEENGINFVEELV